MLNLCGQIVETSQKCVPSNIGGQLVEGIQPSPTWSKHRPRFRSKCVCQKGKKGKRTFQKFSLINIWCFPGSQRSMGVNYYRLTISGVNVLFDQ